MRKPANRLTEISLAICQPIRGLIASFAGSPAEVTKCFVYLTKALQELTRRDMRLTKALQI
jgi:hypothetical protein